MSGGGLPEANPQSQVGFLGNLNAKIRQTKFLLSMSFKESTIKNHIIYFRITMNSIPYI